MDADERGSEANMTDEEFESYRKERYEPALGYYDRRAQRYKRGHYLCSVFVLVVSVFVAAAQGFSEGIRTIASILAPTIALVSGLAAIYRCHEEWLNARTIWDALRHEKFWRDAKVGPYESSTDRNADFVSRVEALIDKEGTDWRRRQEPSDARKK